MRKLNFGCGGNRLEGWENFDVEMDISKPLPFPDGCASFILSEHVVEHVTHQQAWNFFEECHRILRPAGVLRVCVPSVERIWKHYTQEYGDAVKAGGHGDGGRNSSIRAAVFCHGHQAAWTRDLLETFLLATGFMTNHASYGNSLHHDLRKIDGHGKVVSDRVATVETTIVEGQKL
jgi:predicted SAM-dependent methyltransferase